MSSLKKLPSVFRKHSSRASHGSGESGVSQSSDKEPHLFKDFREKKTSPLELAISSIPSVADAIRHKDAIDDRKYFLEHALTLTSRLGDGPIAGTVQDKIVQRRA